MAAKLPRFNGIELTAEKARVLGFLAACPVGSTAIHGVMGGGTLAALVQMGLAERIPPDEIGGNRYRITAAGQAAAPAPVIAPSDVDEAI